MPHVKFHSGSISGGNSGSSGQLMTYLEKEDKERDSENEINGFFSSNESGMSKDEAQKEIEHQYYKKGLKADADKFYSVTMSFSKDELKDKSNKELMSFAQNKFGEMYCDSVKGREVDPEKLKWVAKLEEQRKYKGDHKDVTEGKAKSGELKPGDNRHIHFVVARKTSDDKQISPMSNHFREGAKTGAVKSGFDQDHMKYKCEKEFDKEFNHKRKEAEKVDNKLGDYRPDLKNKFNEKDIEKTNKKDQAKEAFKSSQKEFDKKVSSWEKVKEYYTKTVDKVKNFLSKDKGGDKEKSADKSKEKDVLKRLDNISKERSENTKDKTQEKNQNKHQDREL